MPFAAKKPCAYPGCPELVKSGFCEKHQSEKQRAAVKTKPVKRPEEDRRKHRLYDRRWKRRRIVQLSQKPWCEDCLRVNIYTPATDVHHVVRHGGDPELFYTSPLISLCHVCHSRRTLGEIRGVREDYYPHILSPIQIPVYLVFGPPASGKSTFVQTRCKPTDLIVDLDVIIAELTGHDLYYPEHPETVREGIRARNRMLEGLTRLVDQDRSAWVILTAADPRDRMVWRDLLDPKTVYLISCSKEECLQRIDKDIRRRQVAQDQKQAVVRWFERYQPLPGEVVIEQTEVDPANLATCHQGGLKVQKGRVSSGGGIVCTYPRNETDFLIKE